MGEVALVMGDIDNGLRERLDAEINAFNVAAASCADGGLLSIAVRGDGGQLCGGMFGWTWGGRGFIEFLWVRGDHRGSGLGLGCWLRAEQEAQRRGCDQVALSTHSFQAPGPLRPVGLLRMRPHARLPRGYDHIHLVKQLR